MGVCHEPVALVGKVANVPRLCARVTAAAVQHPVVEQNDGACGQLHLCRHPRGSDLLWCIWVGEKLVHDVLPIHSRVHEVVRVALRTGNELRRTLVERYIVQRDETVDQVWRRVLAIEVQRVGMPLLGGRTRFRVHDTTECLLAARPKYTLIVHDRLNGLQLLGGEVVKRARHVVAPL